MGASNDEARTANNGSEPWKWPLEWFADDRFWRDVASRALAGLIVVGISGAVAVGSGLLDDPIYGAALLRLLLGVIVLLIWAPISSYVITRVKNHRGKFAVIATAIGSMSVLIAILYFLAIATAPNAR